MTRGQAPGLPRVTWPHFRLPTGGGAASRMQDGGADVESVALA